MKTVSYSPRQQQLQNLVRKLGLSEQGAIAWNLLDLALTHPSISSDVNYEQLEFVGDAVVRLAVAELLFQEYRSLPVGEFAALRSILVSDRTLARIAEQYGLDRYLLVADSAVADQTGKETRLAEAFEAMLGALFLSTHTLEFVHPWLDVHLRQLITEIRQDPARQNYKAALQEWTQGHYKQLPEYRVQEIGTLHADPERFQAEVWLLGQLLGQGKGRSIKAAEQAAAQVAYLALTQGEISLDEQR